MVFTSPHTDSPSIFNVDLPHADMGTIEQAGSIRVALQATRARHSHG